MGFVVLTCTVCCLWLGVRLLLQVVNRDFAKAEELVRNAAESKCWVCVRLHFVYWSCQARHADLIQLKGSLYIRAISQTLVYLLSIGMFCNANVHHIFLKSSLEMTPLMRELQTSCLKTCYSAIQLFFFFFLFSSFFRVRARVCGFLLSLDGLFDSYISQNSGTLRWTAVRPVASRK